MFRDRKGVITLFESAISMLHFPKKKHGYNRMEDYNGNMERH